MVQLQLERQKFPTWRALDAGHLAGQVYADGAWLSLAQINERLRPLATADELATELKNWNGFFALVWEREEVSFLACDLARSIPLFWQVGIDGVTVKDQLRPADSVATVWQQENILVQTEFVPGHATLRYGWQQLQAGELLEIRGTMCYMHTYFSHQRTTPFSASAAELQQQFSDLLLRQMQRLVDWADGRTIVVPLSGGYDSRIILAILCQLKYPKIKAFTYGQAGSWEVELAEKIAKQLGVEWQFVNYTPKLLARFWTDDWASYADYAGNACVLPQDQDYYALSYLRELGWLEAGSVICPGYCGDFQAGSYLPGSYFKLPWRRSAALQDYLYHRFVRYPSDQQRALWQNHLPQGLMNSEAEIISELENWVLREYVSKYIINGVRAYEWFDCAWYLPLWDSEFIRFWQAVPNSMRAGMHLYRKTLAEHFFAPLQLNFPKEEQTVAGSSWLRDVFPAGAKAQLKDKLKTPADSQDINGIHVLIPQIQDHLNWPNKELQLSINEMMGHWYLNRISTLSSPDDISLDNL